MKIGFLMWPLALAAQRLGKDFAALLAKLCVGFEQASLNMP